MGRTEKVTTGSVDVVLPPKHLQAIGHVVAQWSIFEDFVNLMILGLLGVSQTNGRIITNTMNITAKLRLVRALAKEALPSNKAKKRFEIIAKRFQPVLEKRNSIVHAIWAGPDHNGSFLKAKYTGSGQSQFHAEKMTAANIEAIAGEISILSGDIYGFMLDNALFPTSGPTVA